MNLKPKPHFGFHKVYIPYHCHYIAITLTVFKKFRSQSDLEIFSESCYIVIAAVYAHKNCTGNVNLQQNHGNIRDSYVNMRLTLCTCQHVLCCILT